jgi:hypothetical protein
MLDVLGKLALHVSTLRSLTLGVQASAAAGFEVYVGGRALRADLRRELPLALEAKGLNLRRDMVD